MSLLSRLGLPFDAAPTGPLGQGVYAVRDGIVNLYLVIGGEAAIAIDAGQNQRRVAHALAKLPVGSDAVAAVFLTHGDSDHVGALSLMPNATVYLGRDEEQMVEGRTPRFGGRVYGTGLGQPYTLLDDGQVVTAGDLVVQAIATPGHTPGSMSYLVNDRLLFTGDTLSLRRGVAGTSPRPINMDNKRERASIRKLAQLEGVALLCTGHSGCTADWASAMAPWRV